MCLLNRNRKEIHGFDMCEFAASKKKAYGFIIHIICGINLDMILQFINVRTRMKSSIA